MNDIRKWKSLSSCYGVTSCVQVYFRRLVLTDSISARSVILSVRIRVVLSTQNIDNDDCLINND